MSSSSVPCEAASQRSGGKGRRRRAATEQRRIDQQRLGEFLSNDSDAEMAPSQASHTPRRRRRRSLRRQAGREEISELLSEAAAYDCLLGPQYADNEEAVELALALSLSLTHPEAAGEVSQALELSYETLLELENVTCATPAAAVGSLNIRVFESVLTSPLASESCVICQADYTAGDVLLCLPCKHDFHRGCCSHWLLKYSKLCPVCKVDVTV